MRCRSGNDFPSPCGQSHHHHEEAAGLRLNSPGAFSGFSILLESCSSFFFSRMEDSTTL
jgi:hypothetical protein